MSLKLTVGIIAYNSDFFLKQAIEAIEPFAHKICVAYGPVKWWYENPPKEKDRTHQMLQEEFIRLDGKMVLSRTKSFYYEKTEQCRHWFQNVPEDTDYILCVDADEVHKPEHIENLIRFLEDEEPTSVGFKSDTFFGGFDHVLTGFEREHSFTRVLKYVKGCEYLTHRQPTLAINGSPINGRDITGWQLYDAIGFVMPHYSYISPRMVHDKIEYYRGAVIAPGKCIPDYFEQLWLPWVTDPSKREYIEHLYRGVHEFAPDARGECYTESFKGKHPYVIERDMEQLKHKFNQQLAMYAELETK